MAIQIKCVYLDHKTKDWLALDYILHQYLARFKSLEQASKECEKVTGALISPNTLSRVSRGYEPDLRTFGALWQWMGLDIRGVRVVL